MAIYHLTATIISRGRGQSAVAAAAYRLGATLRDEHYGVTHNYLGKRGVVHSEIVAPASSPAWVHDRGALWNAVEAGERRKDSQLARLIEVGLPVELSAEERVCLVRDYVANELVAKGMIADFCIRGESTNPHAHILLTLRLVTPLGFGPKQRLWNGKALLQGWRSSWAIRANEHLARAGHAVRIDHRTLEAQQIELTPGRRIGVGRARRADATLPFHMTERVTEQQQIAFQNGVTLIEDPTVALRALTHQRPIFRCADVERFLKSRTFGDAQFDEALIAIMQSTDCVALDPDAGRLGRFTSRDLIEAEASLKRRAATLADRRGHGIATDPLHLHATLATLDETQRPALDYLIGEGDAKAVAASPAAGALLMTASRRLWEEAGFTVMGTEWQAEQNSVTRATIILLDASHRLGIKEMERVLAAAEHARAKAVLIGDADQLKLMKVAPPFQGLLHQIGFK